MKKDQKKYVYDIISNSGGRPELLGQIWWNGRTVDCDIPRILDEISGIYITNKTISDGLEFFNLLPLHFSRNGYMTLKRKK